MGDQLLRAARCAREGLGLVWFCAIAVVITMLWCIDLLIHGPGAGEAPD